MKEICIAGKNNIAVDCLYYILSFIEKEKICVVLNKTDTMKNTWQKSLGFYAVKENIEIKTLQEVQEIKGIIFLSLEFDRLLKPALFKTSRLYNIHFSLLPQYKGMYTSLLPILHGKNYSGVTLHKIDRGVDTGDIIAQSKIDISDFSGQELYKTYLVEGTKLVCDNFKDILDDTCTTNSQPSIQSTYFSKHMVDFSNLEINLAQTSYQIHCFIKAFSFRVYQLSQFNGVDIISSEITEIKSTLKPGSVVEENPGWVIVATIDYDIKLVKDYYNVLCGYAKDNDFDRAKQIVKYVNAINDLDRNGWNPLIIAAYHGAVEMVDLLLKNGADPNARNINRTIVIMYAKDSFLKTRDISIINNLIEAGADIFLRDIYHKTLIDYVKDKPLLNYLHTLDPLPL